MARSRSTLAAVYLALLVVALGVFAWVVRAGSALHASLPMGADAFGKSAGGAQLDFLLHVLLALLVITGAARIFGRAARYIGQPPVIGETIAGLALGPSLLGRIAPHAAAFLLPAAIAPLIQVLAQVGVILFMFLVGVELDPDAVRERGRSAIGISHASMVVPFTLGSVLALHLYPRLATPDVPFLSFALFVGISMSVTAFPVLARILDERGLTRSPLGALALTCAAVDDVTAWCLLALVVGVVKSHMSGALVTVVLAIAYLGVVFVGVRPLLARIAKRVEASGTLSRAELAWVLLIVIGSALATDAIGIHALFGAFIVGACVPDGSVLAKELRRRIEDLVLVLLLPAFFALTGMRTQLALVGSDLGSLALVFFVAIGGKLGGSTIAARASGLSWRDASAIGILMNTRGLMELVVLNIGLDLHVITPALFAMLVLMAVGTTLLTSPLLSLVQPKRAAS